MQMNTVSLKKIVEKIRDLPTLPSVVMRVVAMAQDPDASASDVESILSHDPSLTMKVMRVANSSFYGFGDIKTLKEAVMGLGFPASRSVVLSTSVFESFPGTGQPGFDRAEFWRHSLAVAVASRLLAVNRRFPEIEEAFIAGLIHDIGKIVLDEYASEAWQAVLSHAAEKKILIFEAERVVLGCSHAQVGRWLAGKWKLPAHFSSAIFYHHQPSFACHGEVLVSFVHLSDILARTVQLGWGGDPLVPMIDPEAWARSGMKEEDFHKIRDALPEAFAKAEASFAMPG
jgi:HD-like signal output (HDOD) protein